jgi:hypothetical protein
MIRMIVDSELERICKEAVLSHFQRSIPGLVCRYSGKSRKTQSLVDALAEIGTGNVPNTSQKHCSMEGAESKRGLRLREVTPDHQPPRNGFRM